MCNSNNKSKNKKVKIRSRTNSLINSKQFNALLEPAKQVFVDNLDFKINYLHFKAIIENAQYLTINLYYAIK